MNALSIRKMKEKAPGKLLNCIKEAVAIGLLEHPEKLTLDKRLFLLLPEDKQQKVTAHYKGIFHNLPEDIDTYSPEEVYDTISSTILMSSSESITSPKGEVIKSIFDTNAHRKRLQRHHHDLNETKYSEDMEQPDESNEISEAEFQQSMDRVAELRSELEGHHNIVDGGINWMDPDKLYD